MLLVFLLKTWKELETQEPWLKHAAVALTLVFSNLGVLRCQCHLYTAGQRVEERPGRSAPPIREARQAGPQHGPQGASAGRREAAEENRLEAAGVVLRPSGAGLLGG